MKSIMTKIIKHYKNKKMLVCKMQNLSKCLEPRNICISSDLQILRKAWGNMPPDMSIYEKRIFIEIAEKILKHFNKKYPDSMKLEKN